MSGHNEETLVDLLKSGDKTALRDFYNLYAGRLTAVCARYISDDEDLKDVMQDTLVMILSHIHKFRYQGEGSLKAWTTRIAVNQSLKFLREQNHHEMQLLSADMADEIEEEDPVVGDMPPYVLHRLIRELPAGYRTVLNLFVFEGWTHQEIAKALGIKKDTSASQFSKAKKLLAKKINEFNNSKRKPR